MHCAYQVDAHSLIPTVVLIASVSQHDFDHAEC